MWRNLVCYGKIRVSYTLKIEILGVNIVKKQNGFSIKKRVLSIWLVLCFVLSGCGSENRDFLTLDVFAGRANYQGMQEGWYAKLVRDKFNLAFNIIAPNVSGGGNLLFETRLSSGKVGDIVITSLANMKQCLEETIFTLYTCF